MWPFKKKRVRVKSWREPKRLQVIGFDPKLEWIDTKKPRKGEADAAFLSPENAVIRRAQDDPKNHTD